MSAATVVVIAGTADVTFAFADGRTLSATLHVSRIPTWFRADGMTPAPHTILLAPSVTTYTVDELAAVLRHEFEHIDEWARYGVLAFLLMDFARLARYGASDHGGNSLEQEAYDAERADWESFVSAAQTLRDAKLF